MADDSNLSPESRKFNKSRSRFAAKPKAPTAGKPASPTLKRPSAQKIIAEHTVGADETLGHISLKYYGSSIKDKYMQIYEANKAAIGDNPNRLKVGTKLNIPELKG